MVCFVKWQWAGQSAEETITDCWCPDAGSKPQGEKQECQESRHAINDLAKQQKAVYLLTEAACRCWVFTKWDKGWYKSLSSSAIWLSKTTIRHWSYKLQQAEQFVRPICYAKFKIRDLKNYFKQSFLDFSEELVTHFKAIYEPLLKFECQTSTWI